MSSNSSNTPTSASIWLVEDHVLFREEMAKTLDDADGIYCTAEFSSIEKLEAYLSDTVDLKLPDIVLMDINLRNGMSGIEGTKLLKSQYPNLIIIMLTLSDDAASIYEAVCEGATGYILKDSREEDVITSIWKAMKKELVLSASMTRKVLGYLDRDIARANTPAAVALRAHLM